MNLLADQFQRRVVLTIGEMCGLGLVVIWIGVYLLVRLMRSIRGDMPRPQSSIFVLRLRDIVFREPAQIMMRLWAEDRVAFVKGLWKEVGWPVARHGLPAGLPSDGMEVYRLHIPDGRAIAVVKMPEAQRKHETLLIGIVLPEDESLKHDLIRARHEVRFFFLNGWASGRDTDLCGWTIERELRTYNVGAPRDPEGFARALGAKLTELGL